MQKFKVSELIPHSQNEFFFDDMEGQKWKEFLESVRTSGVIEPPVVTNEGVIVSGHQRIRACKELGIDEIFCEVRIYDDPDKVIKDLIETNIRQRGTIAGSELKMGRVWDELRRIYGVKNGNNQFDREPHNAAPSTKKELAKKLGKSEDTLDRYSELKHLIPGFQEILEEKRITATTASNLIASLSEEEQIILLSKLPSATKFTQAQIQQYIEKNAELEMKNKGLEREKQELQEEAVEAVKMAKGAAKASDDSAEYLRMKEAKETAEEERRRYYEKWKEEEKKNKGLSADEVQKKVDEAVAKTKQEYRKLVDAKEKTIAELQDQEPETVEVEVEVIPDDYDEIKAENERLKRQLESAHQTDFSKQFKRMGAIEEKTPEDLRIGFERRLVNETGAFLSIALGLEVDFKFCPDMSGTSKALVRRNIEQLQQVLTKMDAAIMRGETECKSA